MICLTGDIHHESLNINEQLWLRKQGRALSEVEASGRYVRLCEKYNVKCTFYTTGKTLAEQWDEFRPIVASPLVEIGGHTYCGLPRSAFSRLRDWLSGRISISHGRTHGSYACQERDVQKMMAVARRRLGKDIVSWRSHGFVRDENTYPILAQAGIRFISEYELNWEKPYPKRTREGLISHPVNVIMDHDHIFHAYRTREYVEKQKRNWNYKEYPLAESYTIEEWVVIVEKQVRAIEEQGGVATLLIHPLCMYTVDEFRTMERLLNVVSKYKTIWASETEGYLQDVADQGILRCRDQNNPN